MNAAGSSQKLSQSVSFVLFVYNEANILESAIKRIVEALDRDFEDFEVILIDDGSRDETGKIMATVASSDPRLVCLPNHVNLNIGVSIQRGLAVARKEFCVYDAVDLPLAPEDVKGLIEEMHDCDVLLLDRKAFAGYSRWRWITSNLNRALLHALFKVRWRDMNYSQVFRTRILRDLRCMGRSPAFTAPELILRAHAVGYRVKSIPVDYHPRPVGESSLGRPHDLLWSTYDMLRFRLTTWAELSKHGLRPAGASDVNGN